MLESASRGGVCSWGGSAWSGGCVCSWGGVWCLLPEGSAWSRGVVCLVWGVGIPACIEAEPPPLVNRMTDRCKNIILATTSLRPVKIQPCCPTHHLFSKPLAISVPLMLGPLVEEHSYICLNFSAFFAKQQHFQTRTHSVECKPPTCREYGLHKILKDVDILL